MNLDTTPAYANCFNFVFLGSSSTNQANGIWTRAFISSFLVSCPWAAESPRSQQATRSNQQNIERGWEKNKRRGRDYRKEGNSFSRLRSVWYAAPPKCSHPMNVIILRDPYMGLRDWVRARLWSKGVKAPGTWLVWKSRVTLVLQCKSLYYPSPAKVAIPESE